MTIASVQVSQSKHLYPERNVAGISDCRIMPRLGYDFLCTTKTMPSIVKTIPTPDSHMALYSAAPAGAGPFAAVVVIQHAPGLDSFMQAMAGKRIRQTSEKHASLPEKEAALWQ